MRRQGYMILEHPNRGIVTQTPTDAEDNKYHFRWTISRSDEEAVRFWDLKDARWHKTQCQAQVGPNHEVVIRRSGDWEAVG